MTLAGKGHCGCAMFHDLFKSTPVSRLVGSDDGTAEHSSKPVATLRLKAKRRHAMSTNQPIQERKQLPNPKSQQSTQLDDGVQLRDSNEEKKPLGVGERPK